MVIPTLITDIFMEGEVENTLTNMKTNMKLIIHEYKL